MDQRLPVRLTPQQRYGPGSYAWMAEKRLSTVQEHFIEDVKDVVDKAWTEDEIGDPDFSFSVETLCDADKLDNPGMITYADSDWALLKETGKQMGWALDRQQADDAIFVKTYKEPVPAEAPPPPAEPPLQKPAPSPAPKRRGRK